MYLSPTSKIVLIVILILFILNSLYYLRIKKKNKLDKYRIFNFLNRNLLLIYLIFFYLHWPNKQLLINGLYLFAIVLLLVETTVKIIVRSKWDKYYWIDNTLNIILLLLFIRTYII